MIFQLGPAILAAQLFRSANGLPTADLKHNVTSLAAQTNTPGSDGCVRVHIFIEDKNNLVPLKERTILSASFYSSHGYLADISASSTLQNDGYWAGSFYDTARIEWGLDISRGGTSGSYRSQRSGFQSVPLYLATKKDSSDPFCYCSVFDQSGGCKGWRSCQYHEITLWDPLTCQNYGYASPPLCGGKTFCDQGDYAGTYGVPVTDGNMYFTGG